MKSRAGFAVLYVSLSATLVACAEGDPRGAPDCMSEGTCVDAAPCLEGVCDESDAGVAPADAGPEPCCADGGESSLDGGVPAPDGGDDCGPACACAAPTGSCNFTALAMGAAHGCGVDVSGSVLCWGSNLQGATGPSPGLHDGRIAVVPGVVDAVEVAAGSVHTCALERDGDVLCWGRNQHGELGRGAPYGDEPRPEAARVDLAEAVVGITADGFRTCAWSTGPGGDVYCWGGSPSRISPQAMGLPNTAQACVDEEMLCVLDDDGITRCVEHASTGAPAVVSGLVRTVGLACGGTSRCAIDDEGSARCWERRAAPALDRDLSDARSIALDWQRCVARGSGVAYCRGRTHSRLVSVTEPLNRVFTAGTGAMALSESGRAYAWGGPITQPYFAGRPVTADLPVDPGPRDVTAVVVGDGTCATDAAGETTCWRDSTPAPLGGPRPMERIELFERGHGCGVHAGNAHCWGENLFDRLGDSTPGTRAPTPVTLPAFAGSVVSVSVSRSFACALDDLGAVYCWGSVPSVGPTAPRRVVVEGVAQVASTDGVICVRRTDGAAQCWGTGPIGNGSAASRDPATVSGLSGVVDLAIGSSHACAVLDDGSARCWGQSSWGALGDGSRADQRVEALTPVRVLGITDAVSVAAGGDTTCFLRRGGGVLCTGQRPGDGHGLARGVPVPVPGLTDVVELTAGIRAVCARTRPGELRCWGEVAAFRTPSAPCLEARRELEEAEELLCAP